MASSSFGPNTMHERPSCRFVPHIGTYLLPVKRAMYHRRNVVARGNKSVAHLPMPLYLNCPHLHLHLPSRRTLTLPLVGYPPFKTPRTPFWLPGARSFPVPRSFCRRPVTLRSWTNPVHGANSFSTPLRLRRRPTSPCPTMLPGGAVPREPIAFSIVLAASSTFPADFNVLRPRRAHLLRILLTLFLMVCPQRHRTRATFHPKLLLCCPKYTAHANAPHATAARYQEKMYRWSMADRSLFPAPPEAIAKPCPPSATPRPVLPSRPLMCVPLCPLAPSEW